MTLSPESLDILEQRVEDLTEDARNHAGDEHKKAAALFSKAADVHERLAEAKDSPVVVQAHENKAESLRSNAQSQLRDAGLNPSNSTRDESRPETDVQSEVKSTFEEVETDDTQAAIEAAEFFENPPSTELEDVGGLDAEIGRIHDGIIKPHLYPEVFNAIGVDMSNGVLLYGPPGTGKSLIARAAANELGYPYAGVSAAELGSEYVNKGAQNVQRLFAEAKQIQPCVVFVDELDSLARSRSGGPEQTDGTRQMITQLLQELDAIQGSEICVVGATNLVEDIDGAIRRSGRFDRKIHIGAPDADDRRDIFQIHLEDKRVSGDLDWNEIIEWTDGFSGADIASVVRQAGQAAASESIDEGVVSPSDVPGITHEHLMEQIKEKEPGVKEWEEEQNHPLS
jgi:transitional endoplasmic reticulum ATPase